MFTLTVTEDEITTALELLLHMFPEKISLPGISFYVYQKTDEISKRKTRLCITALRAKGHLIVGNKGYVLAGDDPEQVIHFVNGLYSRAHKLTKEADTMFYELKRKYGNEVSAKVKVNPDQPALGGFFDTSQVEPIGKEWLTEPAFQKTYDAKGSMHV